jgi:hypothetical protein
MPNPSSDGKPRKRADLPSRAIERSVQVLPDKAFLDSSAPGSPDLLYINLSTVADQFTPWGKNVRRRDKELREFWPSEPYLAGAVYSVAAAHAAFRWELAGPPQSVEAVRELLVTAAFGKGWEHFCTKLSLDIATQDNGGVVELIRPEADPRSPVIGINNLDADRCTRTGHPEWPIIYTDMEGQRHKMPWFSVLTFEEFPSPIESMFGVQYCAVTRVLRLAQILRDIEVYKSEKVSGRFERAIHIVGGPAHKQLGDVMRRSQEEADNRHLSRYVMPIILASLDPERPVSHVEIPLASLPDNFNFDEELRWYIAGLALGFGRDYQDFAPLPGGALGSSQQSEILHMKSRGKGPALFMRMIQHKFNYFGVMPSNVSFVFAEQDLSAESDEAKITRLRAETRKSQIESGEITPEVARQIAVDEGDLNAKYLSMMNEVDVTPPGQAAPKPGSAQDLPKRKPAAATDRKPTGKGLELSILDDDELDEIQEQKGFLRRMIDRAMRRATRDKSVADAAEALVDAAAAMRQDAERPIVANVNVDVPQPPAPAINVLVPDRDDGAPQMLEAIKAIQKGMVGMSKAIDKMSQRIEAGAEQRHGDVEIEVIKDADGKIKGLRRSRLN